MFSHIAPIIVAASSRTNDESGKRKSGSMRRKLALLGRVKGVGGITQQIGERASEREETCVWRDCRGRAEGIVQEARRERKWSCQRGDRGATVNTIISLEYLGDGHCIAVLDQGWREEKRFVVAWVEHIQ